jgi:hypothetical protein
MDRQWKRDTLVGKSVTAFFATLLLANVVNAQSALFTLEAHLGEVSPGVGAWELFAEVSSGDNAGLVSFNVPLVNVNYPVTIETPYLEYYSGGYRVIGMHNLEVNTAPAIGASQDTITPMPFVFGFGQTDGTLTLPGGMLLGSRNTSYEAKLLLASGTYSKAVVPDILTSSLSANVFDDMTSPAAIGASVTKLVVFVPEPATIALLLLGAVFVLAAARRRR